MIKALILYAQFFTRIPVPLAVDEPIERMRRGIYAFTFFGLIIGVIEGLFFWVMTLFFPLSLSFFITLVFDGLITGGFHLDALADMADGLFSSRNKEKMLEIMKDSRIGSNGVLALIFYYGLLIGGIVSFQDILTVKTTTLLVISFSMIGKTGISLLFYKMKYAGATQGLGSTFLNVNTPSIVLAQLFSLLILYTFFSWAGLIAYSCVFIVSLFYKRLVYKKVEGLNGDTIGAYACISQVVFLLSYFAASGALV